MFLSHFRAEMPHRSGLNAAPVNEFCQRRYRALFCRPASNLGASQRRTPPIKPRTNCALTWPCGNRQISGCCHFCQSSSIACTSAHRSWIPSINNIFSFGMTGVDKIRFNRVVSIASCAGLRAWSVSRTRRQTTGWEHLMRTPGTVRTAQVMRISLHAVKPAVHPPNEKPRSATDGQPSPSSQPVSARISATFCAMARANSKQFSSKGRRADGVEAGRERRVGPH